MDKTFFFKCLLLLGAKDAGSKLPCITISLLIYVFAQFKSTDQSNAIQSILLSYEYFSIFEPDLKGKPMIGE